MGPVYGAGSKLLCQHFIDAHRTTKRHGCGGDRGQEGFTEKGQTEYPSTPKIVTTGRVAIVAGAAAAAAAARNVRECVFAECVLHFGQEIKLHFHYFRIARQPFGHPIRSTGPQFNYKLPELALGKIM